MKHLLCWFGTGLALASVTGEALAAAQMQPWAKWARNPLTIPLTVKATEILAATNGGISITLADGLTTQAGLGCSNSTNAPALLANLQVRREYVLTVEATNFTGMDMTLSYQPNWAPLSRRGRASQPKTYRLLVDRELSLDNFIHIPATNSCSYWSNSWTIELTERLPANWRMEDGSDDPEPAPGDGKWTELGPGKSLDKSRMAFHWSISLGRLMDGLSAGRLSVREGALTPEIYTPTNIFYTAGSGVVRDQVELILKEPGSPVLRQVRAYQTFVDIVPLTNSTEMRFYLPTQVGTSTNSNGHFTSFTGDPFVVWALVNPVPSTTENLQIVERRNGVNSYTELYYNPTSSTATWTLSYGSSGEEQRIETRGVAFSYSSDTNRIETVEVRYATESTPAYKAEETYQLFPWGFELVKTRIDPDNNSGTTNDLITTVTFNTATNAPHSYGKPDTMTYPDGFWEKRIYDDTASYTYGTLLYVLNPDRDSTTNDIVSFPTSFTAKVKSYDYDVDLAVSTVRNRYDSTEDNLFREDHMTRSTEFSGTNSFDHTFDGSRIMEADGALVGDRHLTTTEDWYFGYFGHEFFGINAKNAGQVCYYKAGVYDTTNRVFTVNSDEPGDGPDWRKSVIYAGRSDLVIPEEEDPVSVSEAEGQPLYFGNPSLAPDLYAFKSWRESFIYQKGSLVQREMHVFTGMDTNSQPVFDLVCKWVHLNDSLGHATNITWLDGITNGSPVSRVIYTADYRTTNGSIVIDGDLKKWEMDETGTKTFFIYDSHKWLVSQRKEGVSGLQADITTAIGYDAYGRTLAQTNAASGLTLITTAAYDLAGRPTSQTDTNGLTTSFAYDLGGKRTTKTLPSGTTEIRENYFDRQLKSITGTGVVQEFHDWEFTDSLNSSLSMIARVRIQHSIRTATTNSARLRNEGLDWVGRPIRFETLDWISTNSVIEYQHYLNERPGRLTGLHHSRRLTSPTPLLPPASQAFYYDFEGMTNLASTLIDLQSAGNDLETPNRVSRMAHRFQKISGHWFRATTNLIYLVNNSTNATFRGASHERLNGFSSGNTLSEVQSWDADSQLTTVTITLDQSAKKVTEVSVVPFSNLAATNITINGLLQTASTPSVAVPVLYGYDALGRQTSVTNSLGFVSSTAYNSVGQVSSMTDFTGLATTFEYYGNGSNGAGQLKSRTANGKKTSHSYTARGELHRTWGDVPFPEEREYTEFGELKKLFTYRGGSSWNGSSWSGSPGTPDTTTWAYQEHSGLLASKTDHLTNSVSFTYEQGLLKTVAWARGGTVKTNLYNDLGELIGINYSDTNMTDVAYVSDLDNPAFNREGLPLITKDACGIWSLAYDHAGRMISYACANGTFNGITVSNRYDPVFGLDLVRVTGPPSPLQTQYYFDTYGRMSALTNGSAGATSSYLANSDLLQTTTSGYSGTTRLTSTRTWDFGTRLRSIGNVAGSSTISAHSYVYDAWNRRTRATLEDSSAWAYDYDDRDEVVRGKRSWADFMPVAGQQFEYGYDSIGNRTGTLSGGDQNGAGLRSASYSVNAINQYSQRGVPSAVDVTGLATGPATVTVNGSAADHRKVEYFWEQLSITNNSGPAWTPVTVVAIQGSSVTNTGNVLSPPATQTFSYDADGNTTNDLLWSLTWDGENRLIKVESLSTVTSAAKRKVEFAYDYQGRRSTKKSYTHDGSNYVLQQNLLLVRDGGNLVAELNATNLNTIRSYAWGQDLSGTLEGAGGIGGLVVEFDHTSGSAVAHFPAFDGNGNVTRLVKQDGTISAIYEHGPFGEPLTRVGSFAGANPIRWGTKYYDEETEWTDYGVRVYSPSRARFLSPDPIGEEGGLNLYAFVANNPINAYDPLGMDGTLAEESQAAGIGASLVSEGVQGFGLYMRVKSAVEGFNVAQRNLSNLLDGDISDEDFAQAWADTQSFLTEKLTGKALGSIKKLGAGLGVVAKKPPPVIGEGMKKYVIPKAEEIKGHYYKPKGEYTLPKNKRWARDMKRQIDRGEREPVVDVGPDPIRKVRSKPYQEEQKIFYPEKFK